MGKERRGHIYEFRSKPKYLTIERFNNRWYVLDKNDKREYEITKRTLQTYFRTDDGVFCEFCNVFIDFYDENGEFRNDYIEYDDFGYVCLSCHEGMIKDGG